MKQALITLLITLAIALTGLAQSCLPDGISFHSQVDIDIFPLQHPNCTSVEGDVYLYGGDISNLQGLSNLTSIGGTLTITYTGTLPDLSGLNNLVSIGGNLVIEQTTGLLTLNGLNKLATIGGKFQVWNNGSLQNCNGLGALTDIGQDLDIRDCNALQNIDALLQLHTIGGSLIVAYNAALQHLDGLATLEKLGKNVEISYNQSLAHFNALGKVETVEILYVLNNPALTDLKGPDSLKTIKNELRIIDNPALSDLSGLSGLNSVGAGLWLQNCAALTNLHGLEQLASVGGALVIDNNQSLVNVASLSSLTTIGAELRLSQNTALLNLDGLQNLDSLGYSLEVTGNLQLTDIAGLSGLKIIAGGLYISGNNALTSLAGLENITSITGGDLNLTQNIALTDITALDKLQFILGGLNIVYCSQLSSLVGLHNLTDVGGYVQIQNNPMLTDLAGLFNLKSVSGNLDISYNDALSNLQGLENLGYLGGEFRISHNPQLSNCAAAGVCDLLHIQADNIFIEFNSPGCNSIQEVLGQCPAPRPVVVSVQTDPDGDCLLGPGALPAGGVRVRQTALSGSLRPSGDDGRIAFDFTGAGTLTLSLEQFPDQHWSVCETPIVINPDTVSGDTIRATFLLKPLSACPELEVRLNLPPQLGDCAVASGVSVSTQNLGAAVAKNTVTGVVMPAVFELLHAEPPVSGQAGDTLLFNLGDLAPFATGRVNLTVRPKCGAFELGQTFCWAALAQLDNPCPVAPASEIRVSAACDGDSIRFALKNIGNVPTQNLHRFQLIRNKYIQRTDTFALAPQATLNVAVPADGATWRLEATRSDDGSRTAASLETCGGFTPGYLTAFWQDRGPLAADFDCRQMTTGFSPYTLSAVPGGVGPTYLLAANQAVEYTITFQNPKNDTVHYLAIRDALPDGLDPASIQPVAASHPYQWQVRNDRTLVVEFPGIDLPDSIANPAASRGFFTFLINQMPDVPAGTQLLNSASLLFDNTTPVVQTNQYLHTIGEPFPKGQACAAGGIAFYDQGQVDQFPLSYPGCTRILGPVTIQYTAVENLDALNEVQYMEYFFADANPYLNDLSGLQSLDTCGHIYLSKNPALKTLHGLENLVRVNGDLYIGNESPAPDGLTGLENLQSVGGNVSIGIAGLKNATPLGKLRSIGGDAQIGGGFAMENLHGLENLDSVGGTFSFIYSSIISLDGLDNLRTIGGDLWLWENPNLASIAALRQLKTIGGNFILESTALPVLEQLDSLTSIGGDVRVLTNPNLIKVDGLNNLKTVGSSIRVTGNLNLALFKGLNNLDSVPGDVELVLNPLLSEMDALQRLESVGGYFQFGNNQALVTFGGLDSLRHVGGSFVVGANDNLNYFNGFHNLISVGNTFSIGDNPKLIDLFGFEQLDSVGGSVRIAQNPTLNNLEDLRSLRTVGGDFDLVGNYKLVNLDSLIHLRGIGGYLRIESNDLLKDLKGLSQLDSIGGDLSIRLTASLRSLDGLQLLQKIPGRLFIEGNHSLFDLTGLNNVRAIDGEVYLYNNPAMADLSGLNSLKTIGGNFTTRYNAKLNNFAALTKLQSIAGDFWVSNHDALKSFAGLDSLKTIGGNAVIEANYNLKSLEGWGSLSTVGDWLYIDQYNGLTKLGALNQLSSVKGIHIYDNPYLEELDGLNQLEAMPFDLRIYNNPALKKLNGLGNLKSVGVLMRLDNNKALENLDALKNLSSVGESLIISHCDSLMSLVGLNSLASVGWALDISQNGRLSTLNGLEGLGSIGNNLYIYNNAILSTIEALKNVQSIGGDQVFIAENPLLSDCSIYPVCQFLIDMQGTANIHSNAPGCATPAEVEAYCDHTPVHVRVLLDNDGDCLPGAADTPAADVQVYLSGSHQMVLRPSGADGLADFKYLEQGPLTLHLPQFPTANWAVCQDVVHLTPGASQDTLYGTFLLKPLVQCSELTTTLELPTVFRSCLLTSNVLVSVKNTGTVPAEDVLTAVVMPPVFQVIKTEPPVAGQSGDTLLFALDNLKPLEKATVKLTVQTKCDTFLLGQTLCWEAFAGAANTCPGTQPAFSEVHLKAACLAGTGVRFTLTNTGDAPTQGPHRYTVYKNATVVQEQPFNLNAHDSLTVDLPADGATWRMEATKLDDGSLTAAALENCGGLTSGLVNAFWLEKGPPAYDFACAEVVGSFDPNQKTAVPGGAGTGNALPPNRPLQYTIDFQNTGTDTAFRVLLRDILPGSLDIATFRPLGSSHPCAWEIHGMDTLEVLFYPIALPDSNVNEPASHGYFSFEMGQKPDLPDGTTLENTAAIVFDYNPPIGTNTVRHTVGRTTVRADEPQPYGRLWEILGNPGHTRITFRALEWIAGQKQFDLYGPDGRLVRTVQFADQSFEFLRAELPDGLYFFRIRDQQGRVFSGRVVVY